MSAREGKLGTHAPCGPTGGACKDCGSSAIALDALPVQGRLIEVEQEQLTSDDYYTPESVFDALGLRFDLDVCAPPGGIPWVPADRYYSMADDGLSQAWEGRVWMNPPYSQVTPWVRRFIEHGHGVCLVPHARAQWHRDLWDSADALAHPGRFYFHARREIFMPVLFAAFGEECADALQRIGTVRTLRSHDPRPSARNGRTYAGGEQP